GTFFLDEIAELPLQLQAKLLRALQERRFRRVGGKEEISVDVRVIAATNRDLAEEVRKGRFREDLYYRVDVARVAIPPLRERREDIPILVHHFVQLYACEMQKLGLQVEPEVMEVLTRYRWPGNVRELQNFLKRSLAMTRRGVLTVDDLPDEIVTRAGVEAGKGEDGGFFSLRARRTDAFEKQYLTSLLRRHAGDVTRAAAEARIPRGTLYRLLGKHGVKPDEYRARPASAAGEELSGAAPVTSL
ncbi:MAG: sigma-54-dependent Fis family transcriptional regulator, partial [Planctomycetes bacterium]|nr:sigma-54-dependent Fis family transcriptional regulator [Planctomycetota bacterium]